MAVLMSNHSARSALCGAKGTLVDLQLVCQDEIVAGSISTNNGMQSERIVLPTPAPVDLPRQLRLHQTAQTQQSHVMPNGYCAHSMPGHCNSIASPMASRELLFTPSDTLGTQICRLETLYLDMAEVQRLTRLAFKPCSLRLLTSLVLEIDQEIARARLRLGMSLRSSRASSVMIERLLRSVRLRLSQCADDNKHSHGIPEVLQSMP